MADYQGTDAINVVVLEYPEGFPIVGHAVHFSQIWVGNYTIFVAVPSVVGYWTGVPTVAYYSQPWEYCADILGGVNRIYGGEPYPYMISAKVGALYWFLSLIS